MKLWFDTPNTVEYGQTVRVQASQMTAQVNRQIMSRATKALTVLKNTELEVMRGKGGGRTYKKHGGGSYTASAPGQVPARRTGNLRLHWTGDVKGSGNSITIEMEAQEHYAGYLEYGTRKMARRPYKEKIEQKALPKIMAIFNQPYF